MRVAIAGGNGFIGRELTCQLRTAGHDVVWLSHRVRRVALPPGVQEVPFDVRDQSGPWQAAVSGSQGVVNLSGPRDLCRESRGSRTGRVRERERNRHLWGGRGKRAP